MGETEITVQVFNNFNEIDKLGQKLGSDYSCKKVFMLLHKND